MMPQTRPPLLDVHALGVRYPGARSPAVDSVGFFVAAGETLAIVGGSGSGKSVTARALMRLDPDAEYGGEIRFDGDDVLAMPPRRLRALRGGGIGMVFQEPLSALNPVMSVGAQLAEALALHCGLSGRAAQAEMAGLLQRVGLDEADRMLASFPHQLSGGQRQRVLIAIALAGKPKLLVADEPTTALDAHLRRQVLVLLKSLATESGMGLLLISHDLPLVRDFADRVAVMHDGRIVETGPTERLFAEPAHDYTRALLAARSVRLAAPLPAVAATLLRARGLHCRYRRSRGWFRTPEHFDALRPTDFELARGETLGVVGASGSGKTTLGLAVLRLVREARGEIDFRSGDEAVAFSRLAGESLRRTRRHLQVVLQDPFASLSPRLTVGEIVGEGLRVHQPDLEPAERRRRVIAALAEVGLAADVADRYPHAFSGGQRQRIAIARALIVAPDLLVLDEPTSALDAHIAVQVLGLLAELQRRHGISYLLITHDLAIVRALAHRVMVLKSGEVVEHGTVDAVFAAPAHPYTRSLISAAALP
ncbi:ABC transporter ATP-binding protein [Jeongeupia chitinilytica]|uniref:ABC transporter ATP-binding protein n=1 Tax=Jeongeupia chitinilytica TaxID=1041641 RepID=A0ABQ3GXW7_9NEIS|nr:dipeptide ABC transporter ATP-binding protein [Jeongeupia chitinilytica]GHD58212.1 ABC transporter ATP-binding protein [Jeongeupia chitinilytica]